MLAVFTVVVFFGISDAFVFKASTRGLERAPFLLCCYAAISIPITAFVLNVVLRRIGLESRTWRRTIVLGEPEILDVQ
jgi:hypothetical protein